MTTIEASPRRRWLVTLAGFVAATVLAVIAATYYYNGIDPIDPSSLPTSAHGKVDAASLPTRDAFVAAVDRDFYTDSGFDAESISVRTVRTLTQEPDGSVTIRQRVIAVKLEDRFTKNEILGFYLNNADFGRGTVGITEAADAYFGTSPQQLSLSQAALLAVIAYDPAAAAQLSQPDGLRAEWQRNLTVMQDHGWVSAAEVLAAAYPAVLPA